MTLLSIRDFVLNLLLIVVEALYLNDFISEDTASRYASWHSKHYK